MTTPPNAFDDTYTVNEDETLKTSPANGVLANDIDPEDQNSLAAFVPILKRPINPLFDFKTNGTFIYQARYYEPLHLADMAGEDTLVAPDGAAELPNGFDSLAAGAEIYDLYEYTVSDGDQTDTAQVKIKIIGMNDAPVADDDSAIFQQGVDTSITIDVLNGDTDVDVWPDPDTLSVAALYDLRDQTIDGMPSPIPGGLDSDTDANDGLSITTAEGGTVTLNMDGTLEYTAAAGFFGIDTFEYDVDDGNGGTDTGLVRVTVLPNNVAPEAMDDLRTVTESETGTTLQSTVLANDNDVDDSPFIGAMQTSVLRRVDVNGTVIAGATGSILDFNADGTFNYSTDGAFTSLALGEMAFVEFDYEAFDGEGLTSMATVTIKITGENADPDFVPPPTVSVYEAGLANGSKDDPDDTGIPIMQTINVTLTDDDATDMPFLAGTAGGSLTTLMGTYGQLEFIDADTVKYTLLTNADHAAIQGHNDFIFDTFDLFVLDGNGGIIGDDEPGPQIVINIVDDINFLAAVPVNDDVVFPALNTLDDSTVDYSANALSSGDTFTLYSGADGQTLNLVGLPNDFSITGLGGNAGPVAVTSNYVTINGQEGVRGTYVDANDGNVVRTFYELSLDPDPDADGETTPIGSYSLKIFENPPRVVNDVDFSAISAGGPQENPFVTVVGSPIGFNGYFSSASNLLNPTASFISNLDDRPGANQGEDDINPNNAGGIGIGNGNIERLEVLEIDVSASPGITGMELDLQGVGGGIADDPDLLYFAFDGGVLVDFGSVATTNINVKGGETVLVEPLLMPGEEIDSLFVALDPADVDFNDKVRINRIATLQEALVDDVLLRFALASGDGDGDQSPFDMATADKDALEFIVTLDGDGLGTPQDTGIDLESGWMIT